MLILEGVLGIGAGVVTWLIGWYAPISGLVLLVIAWRLRQVEEGLGGAIGQARPAAT